MLKAHDSEVKGLDIFSEALHNMQSKLQGHLRVSGMLRKQAMSILCVFFLKPKFSCLYWLFLNPAAQLPVQIIDLCELRRKQTHMMCTHMDEKIYNLSNVFCSFQEKTIFLIFFYKVYLNFQSLLQYTTLLPW